MKTKIEHIDLSKELKAIKETILRQREKNRAVKRLVRELTAVVLLFLSLSISAQSFENINGLGKTTEQVKKLACSDINKFTFLNSGNENGKMYISYYSSDYGAIKYTFSKRNVCVKITISTILNRYLKFTINRYEYAVREVLDNDKRLTEIIRL